MARRRRPRAGFQVTTHIAVVLLLLVVFVAIGYAIMVYHSELAVDNRTALDELAVATKRWDEHRPRDYRYVVERHCECPAELRRPYVVSERNGVATAHYPIPVEADDGRMLEVPPEVLSIAAAFAMIRRADDEDLQVEARFDPDWGYPMSVSVYLPGGTGEATESVEIRDFEVIRDP